MAVEVKGGATSGATFEAGQPQPLFDLRILGGNAWYDLGKDGRFLIPVVKAYLSIQTNLHMETAFWENSPLSHINGVEFGADFQ